MNPSTQNLRPGSGRPDSSNPGSSRRGQSEGYNTRPDESLYTGSVGMGTESPRSTYSQLGYGNPTVNRSGHLSSNWQPYTGHLSSEFGDPRNTKREVDELTYESGSSGLRMGEESGLSTQDAFEHGAFRDQLPRGGKHHRQPRLDSGSVSSSCGGSRFDDFDENPRHNLFGGSRDSRAPRSTDFRSPADKPSVKHLTCWYWWSRGSCIHSDESCLYSHYDTGARADQPVKMDPSLPSVAGRNAIELEGKYTEQLKKISRAAMGGEPTETGYASNKKVDQLENAVKTLGTKLEEVARNQAQWSQQARREHQLMSALSLAAKRGEITNTELEQVGAKMEARLREGEETLNQSVTDIVNINDMVKRQLGVAGFHQLGAASISSRPRRG
ncbi:MAG: hypothetical protein Q9187_001292 [Circinaria calcarea]